MTSNSTARRIISRQSNQEKRIGRLSTVEKSACTDDIIRKRLDTLGNPYVEIGTALINQDNLVVNGDFSFDMAGWSSEIDLQTGFLIPEVDTEHGWLVVAAHRLMLNDDITITSAPIEVDATKSYRTSLQWYDTHINEYSGDFTWTVKVVECDENGDFVKETEVVPASTPTWDTWYEKSLEFTPDATTTTVRIVLYGVMSTNNISMMATARIDKVSLVRAGNFPEIKIELEKVIVTSDDFQVDGTLTAGNISATPTANYIPKADGSGKLDVGWMPSTIDADKLDGIDSTGFGRPVFLTAPITSTAWDGDARSTTAKTLIDLSAVFTTPTAVPAGVKAVLVQVQCRDSASSGTATNHFSISPSSSADVNAIITRCGGMPNDYWVSETGVCPCNANGDIYYQCVASGTSTLDVYLQIWGYWL